MSETVISVENLSKLYLLGQAERKHESLVSELGGLLSAPFRNYRKLRRLDTSRVADGQADSPDLLWALKDVSFEVKRGEALGVIGRNGAGKSTLLKVLSRITEPTKGRVRMRGRVASLLEVGTGFHQELTGRENIYLNGTILGMKRREIDRKFDEIVDFSGVERFLDTPVKRYSSGMKVRLGFAVAAHLEPEILIIDEVLAVGDAEFQSKCMGKMQEVARGGRTILFVSHNLPSLRLLCSRAVLLKDGKLVSSGPASDVVDLYAEQFGSSGTGQLEHTWAHDADPAGDDQARLLAVKVVPTDHHIRTDQALDVVVDYEASTPDQILSVSLVLRREEVVAFNTLAFDDSGRYGRPHPAGRFRSTCHIPPHLLNHGRYDIQVYLARNERALYRSDPKVLKINVDDIRPANCTWYGNWIGATRPMLHWSTEVIDPVPANP
jgi:lipopolysaccharide transport system ATP-binding protein